VTIYEIRCRDCGGEIVTVRADDVEVREVGAVASWRWVCARCETVCGVSIDYGTLDLGIVRDSVVRDRESYEVFADPPPGPPPRPRIDKPPGIERRGI
jgi:hypothetical protein